VQIREEQADQPLVRREQWRRSEQRATVRATALVVVALVVLLIGGGAALLLKQQVDAAPAAARANAAADTALKELNSAQAARDGALAAATDAQRMYQDEIAGANGSQPGQGPMAQQLLAFSQSAQGKYDALAQKVTQARQNWDAANTRARDAAVVTAGQSGYWLVFGLGAFVAAVLATLIVGYVWSERRRDWENRRLLERVEESVANDDQHLEFTGLWHRNQYRLQEYHQIVVNHAQSSRQLTLVVLVAGFMLIATLGLMAWQARDVTSAVATSVAATAGTAVTAYVVQTVLRNAETSTSEVNQFFRNPLEMERILTVERLIEQMAATERDAARKLVILGLVDQALPTTNPPAASKPEE
jgi:hypothetical protein